MARKVPVGVVETPEFLATTSKLMSDEERVRLVDYLGRGKRGGARAIYFYHDAGMPLFALTAFAKNARADLSQQDRNDFQLLTARLVKALKRRKP